MLTLGQHGTLGLAVMLSLFLLPIGAFLWRVPPPLWPGNRQADFDAALAAALTMSFVDLALNSFFAMPLLALAPGLCAAADLPVGRLAFRARGGNRRAQTA